MPLAAEAQLDAVVDDALAVEPLAEPHPPQQVDRALLQHAGAHALLDVLARAGLEDHVVDPGLVQELPEDEAGRAGADDADLRPLSAHERSL